MALKNRRKARGLSLVETALVLPILLLVTFGLIEYGNLILRMQQIENVARQAARTAALSDSTSADVTSTITTMMSKVGLSGKYTSSTTLTGTKGQPVSVTITVTYSGSSGVAITNVPQYFLPTPSTIARTVTMAKEGP